MNLAAVSYGDITGFKTVVSVCLCTVTFIMGTLFTCVHIEVSPIEILFNYLEREQSFKSDDIANCWPFSDSPQPSGILFRV